VGLQHPTEAAGVGAMGALVLALLQRQLSMVKLKEVMLSTTKVTSMVFFDFNWRFSFFHWYFEVFGGEELIADVFNQLPGGGICRSIISYGCHILIGIYSRFY